MFIYTRTAAAVLCALAVEPALAADLSIASDVLDVIEVDSDLPAPSSSFLYAETLAPGRESADALRDLLGVSGSRMGGHGTDVSIRGLGQTRINVLLDGAYVHGACPNRMDPPTSYAPLANYEDVIVIRGAQTLEYGGGGSGGTILFERVTERFDEGESVRGTLEGGYRGNSGTSDVNVDAAVGNETVFSRFIGSYAQSNNYEDGSGNPVRSSYKERTGALVLGMTPSDATRAELSYEKQKTLDLLFPGAGMDSPKAENDMIRAKFESTAFDGPITKVKIDAYRSDVDHVMDNYTLRTLTAAAKMRAPSTSNTKGGRIVMDAENRLGQWTFGIDTQRNDRNAKRYNDTAEVLNSVMWPDVSIDQTGMFAELIHSIDATNRVTAGLRYDHVKSDASKADLDPPGGPMSPNALYAIYYDGAKGEKVVDHNIGGLLRFEHDLSSGLGTLYASLSHSVRTPDATERFMASNAAMPSQRWVGNPDLDPEKHRQAEIGMTLRRGPWDAEASLFYNDIEDYVLRDRYTAAGNNATIYRNIDATLIGGEARLGYRLADNWRAEVGAAYVRAENETDNRSIAQTPPLEGIAAIEYRRDRLLAGGRVRAAAKQTRVDTESSTGIEGQGLDVDETPAWAVLDLYASYEISDALSVDVGMDNVFDETYAQHLNRANAFDPTQVQVKEPGRSGWVKLKAMF